MIHWMHIRPIPSRSTRLACFMIPVTAREWAETVTGVDGSEASSIVVAVSVGLGGLSDGTSSYRNG